MTFFASLRLCVDLLDFFTSSEVYRPAVETGHFIMISLMLPAVAALSGEISRLRERMRRQKNDLAQALERIGKLAVRDELTGLFNRRHILDLLEQERQRCIRSGQSFCILLVDLDHFKRVNDSYGHAAGDEVLRSFAREASRVVRLSDVLARWGGEEFILMMAESRAPNALAGAERLRERIAATRVEMAGVDIRVTLSGGLAEYLPGESIAEAIARADQALYAAKSQGRNRVLPA